MPRQTTHPHFDSAGSANSKQYSGAFGKQQSRSVDRTQVSCTESLSSSSQRESTDRTI